MEDLPESQPNPFEAAAEAFAGDDASDVDGLQAELEATRAERDALRERLQRTAADYENTRKRQQKEAETERQYRILPIATDLLPVLDNLDRALQTAAVKLDAEALLKGVELTRQQFLKVLEKYAVVPITAEGQPFDPHLHQAISQVPSKDHPPMTVLQDVARGFKLHDRVVRPSTVIVTAPPPE